MSYFEITIKEVIEKINANEIYLPAIQRKFVWKHKQIEKLFDSLMRGYPIGTFLFWFIKEENVNKYTFYKFIQEYHVRDNYKNEVSPKPELKKNIIGVLDGQQRLSSMYIALQGTYAYKKPYLRWDNDDAFPKRRLYLNLLNKLEDEDLLYEFKFLTDEEASKISPDTLWFLVKDVLTWGNDPEIDEYYDRLMDNDNLSKDIKEIIKSNRSVIKKSLRILHQRIVIEKFINYFKVVEQDLDKILDVFVRVNSAGTVLSKTDLLFSTIVAHWEKGREEIDNFIEILNKKGEGFRFNSDFIMRACLFLIDAPILFKVESFKQENINKIKTYWDDIKSSLERTVDLIVDFGFNGENLTSQNAIIPIAYYYMKYETDSENIRKGLRKYLIHSLLKKVYGNHGDQVLTYAREALRSDRIKTTNKFCYKNFTQEFEKIGNKTLKINSEDIEEILEYKKGSYTFMVLSLMYPNLKYGQIKFHQDHIHPYSLFTEAKFKKLEISLDKKEHWDDMKDKLPNLQLMEGSENIRKNKQPFKDWLRGTDEQGNPNVADIIKFKNDNYIPLNVSEDFNDFEIFYEERKKILRDKLKKILS